MVTRFISINMERKVLSKKQTIAWDVVGFCYLRMLYVALAGLELSMQTRLAWNSEIYPLHPLGSKLTGETEFSEGNNIKPWNDKHKFPQSRFLGDGKKEWNGKY